ncbi:MAG: MFS transporter [Sulfolobales archaeon]
MEEGFDLRYAYRATAILASIPLLVMYTEGMLIPSLPSIQRQFEVSESMVSWVLSLYLAFGTVSAAILGKLGDVYGKKRMMIIAMSIYTVGAIMTSYAEDFTTLLIARAIQGSGMAMMPLAFSLVREEFPPRLIPQVQGIISAMFGVGILLSLPLGAYISQNYGWQATYHTAIPFILLEDILVVLLIRESRYRVQQKIDWVGAVLLSIALMSGIIGISEGPRMGWGSSLVLGLGLLSLASLTAFIIYERRSSNPLIPLHLISNRNIAIANFGIFMVGFTFQLMAQANTFIFEMPRPNGYGLSILETGFWMLPNAVVQLIAAPILGRQLIRIGTKRLSIAGALVAGAGMILLSYLAFIDLPHMISSTIVIGLGSTMLNISLVNIVIFSVERSNLGTAAGLNTVFRNLGSAWGPAVAGTIMDQFKDTLLLSTNPPISIQVPSHFAYQLIFYLTASLFITLAIVLNMAREVLRK